MTFAAFLRFLPAMGALGACTLTTQVDDLQGGTPTSAGGAPGQNDDGGPRPDSALGTVAMDGSEIIAANQRGLRGIAFSKAVYWVDSETPAIWMSDVSGGDAKPVLSSAQNVEDPFDVDAADKYIFWTEFRSGSVWRAAGQTTTLLGGRLPRAAFLAAIDANTPLVSDLQGDANGKTVWKYGTRLYSRLEQVMGLGRESDNVYWSEPKAVYQGAVDGRDPVKIADATDATGGVATNGIEVFWIEADRELWRQTLASPNTKRRFFVGGAGQKLFDLAVSSTYVFWTDPGTQTVRRLHL